MVILLEWKLVSYCCFLPTSYHWLGSNLHFSRKASCNQVHFKGEAVMVPLIILLIFIWIFLEECKHSTILLTEFLRAADVLSFNEIQKFYSFSCIEMLDFCISMVYFIGTYQAGPECLHCEEGCSKSRPSGCPHPCVLPCHPGECPPCVQMLRIKCHCKITSLYVECRSVDWRNTLVLPAILTVIFFYNSEPLIQYFKEYFSVWSLEAGGLYFPVEIWKEEM